MSHWIYIAMAYGAFALLLLWDFLIPHWSLKNAIRGIRLHQRKDKSA